MCLSQFMAAYGWEITLSLLSGLVTGALTSCVVTQHFKKKEQRESIIQTAKELARECHVLLDLTNQLIDQLALRKYHAYRIASILETLDGETRRRTRNEEVMRAKLSEISKDTLDRLCVEIHNKKLGGKLRAVAARHVGDVLKATDACVDTADQLCLGFGEITDLHDYASNVESTADKAYEDFIKTLEDGEVKQYEAIPVGRDNLKKALFELVSAIAAIQRT